QAAYANQNKLVCNGDHAFDPLISAVSSRHGVAINVLHGNVEYFGTQPIGTLVVLVSAIREGQRGAQDVEDALDELRGTVFGFKELTDAAVEEALDSPHSGGPRTAAQTKKTVQQEVLV
uniref:NIL domain-containing protein n=1 Tax=Bifidobacterium pseudolongum TaxID=1694 RepID=UPI002FD7C7EC